MTASSLTWRNSSRFNVVHSCWSVDFILFSVVVGHNGRGPVSHGHTAGENSSCVILVDSRCQNVSVQFFDRPRVTWTGYREPTLSIMHGNPRKKRKSLLFVYISLWRSLYSLFKSLWFYQVPFSQICGVWDTQHVTWRIFYSWLHSLCSTSRISTKGKLLNECTVKMKKLFVFYFPHHVNSTWFKSQTDHAFLMGHIFFLSFILC